MAITIQTTAGKLAQIAEKSAGYSVLCVEDGKQYEYSNIRFRRSASGRRNRQVVEMDYNGRLAVFDSETPFTIRD